MEFAAVGPAASVVGIGCVLVVVGGAHGTRVAVVGPTASGFVAVEKRGIAFSLSE